jgi:hypothetical protein
MTEFESPIEQAISPRREIGRQLKLARDNLGFSYEHIASIIRIRPALLKALEDGDYSVFSSVVYIRGFIKTYAQFLKIPFEPLLELYQKDPHEKKASQVYDLVEAAHAQKRPGGKLVFATSLCLVLIILVSIDWQRVETDRSGSYKLPPESSKLAEVVIDPPATAETSSEMIQNEDKTSVIEISPSQPEPILTPFGEEHLYLIGIPRTNNPILKPDKITLVPEKDGWIELYNGEALLLRTRLNASQSYLIPRSEVTTLLVKEGDWAKIYGSNKEMKIEKSLTCNDYYCDLSE